jgi:hypothetical protein
MKRAYLLLLVLCSCARAQAAAAPTINPSAPVDFRPGPVVWQEEFWDIKPDKLDEFMAAYRTEVYSIRRHIHGYRGYTVLTTLPKDRTAPQPPEPAGAYQNFISPHYGLYTGSGVLTERSINIGILIRRTHNLIIIQHFQTWADADAYPAAFAAAYSAAHNGETPAEGLAKRLYPFVNNTWSTYYRLVETGFPAHYTGAATGNDADGLNLEPHPEPSYWVKEFFLVDPANAARFQEAYEHDSYAYSRQVRGHHGDQRAASRRRSTTNGGQQSQFPAGRLAGIVPAASGHAARWHHPYQRILQRVRHVSRYVFHHHLSNPRDGLGQVDQFHGRNLRARAQRCEQDRAGQKDHVPLRQRSLGPRLPNDRNKLCAGRVITNRPRGAQALIPKNGLYLDRLILCESILLCRSCCEKAVKTIR